MKVLTTSLHQSIQKTVFMVDLSQLLLEWQQLCLNNEKNIGYGALSEICCFSCLQLAYCVVQFLEKDAPLTEEVKHVFSNI